MKFGVREICNVVLKAKTKQTIGNKTFYRGEPVCYFDTLKTSSMEGAATTVYAQGGRGNARLMAWDGERTVTFTMEDALISPEGLMILTGAGLISADDQPVKQHLTEIVAADAAEGDGNKTIKATLSHNPYVPADLAKEEENYIYVMLMKDGDIVSEPYLATVVSGKQIVVQSTAEATFAGNSAYDIQDKGPKDGVFPEFDRLFVDYYVERKNAKTKQVNITADAFGGNYYLEASTLFRDEDGLDYPAEFIIPNCKVQSNFTFTMASSGDPSTFTFTMDAFPDYTKFDKDHKVLASIQIIDPEEENGTPYRVATKAVLKEANSVEPAPGPGPVNPEDPDAGGEPGTHDGGEIDPVP